MPQCTDGWEQKHVCLFFPTEKLKLIGWLNRVKFVIRKWSYSQTHCSNDNRGHLLTDQHGRHFHIKNDVSNVSSVHPLYSNGDFRALQSYIATFPLI